MTVEFRLPDVGEGIVEAEVVRWLVAPGEAVGRDQPLAEVQTDKAVVVLPSPVAGRVVELVAPAGATVRVGQVLAVLEEDGTAAEGRPEETGFPAPPERATESTGRSRPDGAGLVGRLPETEVLPATVPAAPAVRRLARELGVALERLQGTGPGGRITEQDVRRAAGEPSGSSPPGRARPVPGTLEGRDDWPVGERGPQRAEPGEGRTRPVEGRRVPISGIRRAIARHLSEAVRLAPHVTVCAEADVTRLVELRDRLQGAAARAGVRLTYLPFVVRAAVQALRAEPTFNATVDEASQEVVLHDACHIGVAVATPSGLVVAVVRDAHAKGVGRLAVEIAGLAERARAGRLFPAEMRGSTFTITGSGPGPGLWATPILNHPEVAILGFHRIQERPVARDGQVVIRAMVNLTLTFDHRVADGEHASRFLEALVSHLEEPEALLLDLPPAGSGEPLPAPGSGQQGPAAVGRGEPVPAPGSGQQGPAVRKVEPVPAGGPGEPVRGGGAPGQAEPALGDGPPGGA